MSAFWISHAEASPEGTAAVSKHDWLVPRSPHSIYRGGREVPLEVPIRGQVREAPSHVSDSQLMTSTCLRLLSKLEHPEISVEFDIFKQAKPFYVLHPSARTCLCKTRESYDLKRQVSPHQQGGLWKG